MNLLRRDFVTEIIINAALPWLVYILAQPSMGSVHALMASSLPPLAWSALQFARKKRIDALSMLVLAGIGLSLVAFFGGGSFRTLELREHLVNGVIGLVFLGSAAVKRPILVVLVQSKMKGKTQVETAKLQSLLDERRGLATRLTLVLGFLMLIETAIAVILVFSLPVREFLIVSPILNYAVLGFFVGVAMYTRLKARAAAAKAKYAK